MKRLFKNGTVINVFTEEAVQADVLTENGIILGVGNYSQADVDESVDVNGKYICPGLIDGHIHIESTMLMPAEFAKAVLVHGTTSVVADPHEIANVCGKQGIEYMLKAGENLPVTIYIMLPSCVPATEFDEAGAQLNARDLEPLYECPRVLGLGEVMDFNGVVCRKAPLMQKIDSARARGMIVNGHAPLLSGKELDSYICAGIHDDHECSTAEEAMERIRKGQYVMIRQGTAARNLKALLPLFEKPWSARCMLVTDDKHTSDLVKEGHIDGIIREAVRFGKNPITAIRMATLQAAEYYRLPNVGAIAPGYQEDILILNELESMSVRDVYQAGVKRVANEMVLPFDNPEKQEDIPKNIANTVYNSFHMEECKEKDFHVQAEGIHKCRVIQVVAGELITNEQVMEIDFTQKNGICTQKDILKIAVLERHHNTGHIGIGYISGIGLKEGAIASSVSHDAHNPVVIGTNERDMAFAINRIRTLGGGILVVKEEKVVAELPLPCAGLMSDMSAEEVMKQTEQVRNAAYRFGITPELEPFMTMAFVCLPVIPYLKLTTKGLVDVEKQKLVSLWTENDSQGKVCKK